LSSTGPAAAGEEVGTGAAEVVGAGAADDGAGAAVVGAALEAGGAAEVAGGLTVAVGDGEGLFEQPEKAKRLITKIATITRNTFFTNYSLLNYFPESVGRLGYLLNSESHMLPPNLLNKL
jgi:hypothetical protein